MAVVEYRPKPQPGQEKPRLLKVTRISGMKLADIERYVKDHPHATRDNIVEDLSNGNEKDQRRIEQGIDILNQLSLLGGTATDVVQVIVRQDVNDPLPQQENKPQGNHLWYEVKWVKEPAKPIIPSSPRAPLGHTRPAVSRPQAAPHKTPEQIAEAKRLKNKERREKEKARKRAERDAKIAEVRKEEAETRERTELDGMIVDKGREIGESVLGREITFDVRADGSAQIWRRESLGRDEMYSLVDRETGNYSEGWYLHYRSGIREDCMKYFNVIAEQLEGKDVQYTSPELSADTANNLYERALQSGLLRVSEDSGQVQFQYLEYPETARINWLTSYNDIDLARGVLVVPNGYGSTRDRYLNPQFAAILREKAEALGIQVTPEPQRPAVEVDGNDVIVGGGPRKIFNVIYRYSQVDVAPTDERTEQEIALAAEFERAALQLGVTIPADIYASEVIKLLQQLDGVTDVNKRADILASLGVTDIKERKLDTAGTYTAVTISDPLEEDSYSKQHKISLTKVESLERKYLWKDPVQVTQYEIARVDGSTTNIDFSQRVKRILEGDLENIRYLDSQILSSTFITHGTATVSAESVQTTEPISPESKETLSGEQMEPEYKKVDPSIVTDEFRAFFDAAIGDRIRIVEEDGLTLVFVGQVSPEMGYIHAAVDLNSGISYGVPLNGTVTDEFLVAAREKVDWKPNDPRFGPIPEAFNVRFRTFHGENS